MVAVAVAAVAGLAAWLAWRAVSGPAVGKINSVNSAADLGDKQPGWSLLQGKRFQVEYQSGYSSRPTGVPGEDHYFFVTNAAVSKHLAIAVDSMGSHSLEDEPSYKARLIDTANYKLEKRQIAGISVPVMVKQDGLEQTAFLVRGSTLATIALVAPNANDDLTNELNHMLSTWHWQ